jgi:transposase, IS5 family
MQLALFAEESLKSPFQRNFESSSLGRVWLTIPFQELSQHFKTQKQPSGPGAKPIFSVQGGLGLMFLKHYTGLSDEKLIEQVNTNWHFQLFCGLPPQIHHGIKDKDIVGRWRRFFGEQLNINVLQMELSKAWAKDLPHTHLGMQDATVYESYIKYPTDLKLLWDCLIWVYGQMEYLCRVGRSHGLRMPRSKYEQRYDRYMSFAKKRKKTQKEERRERKAALYLLEKLQGQIQVLLNQLGPLIKEFFDESKRERIKTVRQILIQQKYHFQQPDKSVPHRIVSLYKPYIRPIVRGKETKRVEFGAKVHQLQVGNCNFIEHLDFEAFHEGNRFKKGVLLQRKLFGSVSQVAADGIYATNRNRTFCRENKIATNFVPKGKQSKEETKTQQSRTMRQNLATIRATRLEGSFGNEKNHYLLDKIKARTEKTEVAWIFFGVHCANASKIAKARAKPKPRAVMRA